ncbi:MAG TPA: hypothetical protein VM124_00265 [Candidatus Limnocylindrales bacterium]|nr:hypothetical protein [Candidatus Limnocylindrales bacterium]
MLFWLLILGLIIYLLTRGNKRPEGESAEARLAERNLEWIKFIAGYRKIAKSNAERALIDRMLADIEQQGIVPATEEFRPNEDMALPGRQASAVAWTASSQPDYITEPVPVTEPSMPKIELDNTSLLLYFGAFLFVASVGLFIAFGGANGAIRTIAVLLVMGVLYGGGIWLFHNKPKLIQAGIAFSGIGMTIAPLAGVAAYYYLFSEAHGPGVWFVTSLMCMAMYIHALQVFRRPLISYILIFTFLSLFESGVSIIAAPIYYFGWAMAVVGIVLVAASHLRGFWPELQESSRASSQLMLPLSILTSMALVPQHGAGQLGVSLLFAAAYYGLETWNTKGSDQEANAITAQIVALASLVCFSYAAGHSWRVVAVSLLAMNVGQIVCILLLSQSGRLWRNFASIVMGASVAGILIALMSPGILLGSVGLLAINSFIIWLRQDRADAYALSMSAWTALPIVFGQVFLPSRLDGGMQAVLLLGTLWVQQGIFLWYKAKDSYMFWLATAQQLYVMSAVVVLIAALFAVPWVCFLISMGVVGSVIFLAHYEKDGDWAIVAGLMAMVPSLRSVEEPEPLLVATLVALLLNIALALRYRKELNRWFSTVLWLMLPLVLGRGLLGSWTAASYGWAYVGVMLGLILSRAIARGSIWASAKIPLASYARTASHSYVVGYWLAAIISVSTSLVSTNARFHATAILGIMMVVVYLLGRHIEKREDLMALMPLLAQAVLWSALRPAATEGSMIAYLLCSTLLAAASYGFARLYAVSGSESIHDITPPQEGALVAVFISPLAVFVVDKLLWPMPFGLLVAGSLLYFHVRNTSQQNRELAAAVIVAAFLWFMWLAGIREVQAYTHVVVATLGLYAYWRAKRGENAQSDQYLMSMLTVATVPLGLQALSGQAGGLYGWWLLLEQIGFMLIGMSIKKRLVTLWGLYVAVGAVLYQLRDLGWAALTVLAMFLIGIAVYKLQRHDLKN